VEFQRRFSSDDACREYLAESRWPGGFECPRCDHAEFYRLTSRALLKCKDCGHQTSVTAGTVLHRSHLEIPLWFWAAYLVATHTPGISALQLQRQLGLSRYETAWRMLQKLRRGMVRPERDQIGWMVEVDECFIGGPEEGRGAARKRDSTKAIVIAAVEVRGNGSGRVRLAHLKNLSASSLTSFVERAVRPGSIVKTDGWKGYVGLTKHEEYNHQPVVQGDGKNAAKLLPRVHRVFSNLKTWLNGTHHGVSKKYLPHYLDEFVFRFNRRRSPMAAFQSLLGLCGQHPPTTHSGLKTGESRG
jgi:transposase-like protein